MGKPMLNKGFSMLEMLIVIMIISVINLLYIIPSIDFTYILKLSQVTSGLNTSKMASLKNHKTNCFTHDQVIANYNLCFNEKANVNQAQTLYLLGTNQAIIIHLGSGIHEIKPR